MKYIIVCIAMLSACTIFSSCKRSYTCECYSPVLNKSVYYEIKENSIAVAEDRCLQQNTTGQNSANEYECFIQ